MRVLVACEFSGVVRRAFAANGHDAWSCDLLPAMDESDRHLQCDVREVLADNWDLIIAHPPCTFLCNSGVRFLYKYGTKRRDLERWANMRDAVAFFKLCWNAPAPRVCVENPIMHPHAIRILRRKQSQTVQPWQFGHGETKATCFWLKGLPLLRPTDIVEGRVPRINNTSSWGEPWKVKSITYDGIAKAMAGQWGPKSLQVW